MLSGISSFKVYNSFLFSTNLHTADGKSSTWLKSSSSSLFFTLRAPEWRSLEKIRKVCICSPPQLYLGFFLFNTLLHKRDGRTDLWQNGLLQMFWFADVRKRRINGWGFRVCKLVDFVLQKFCVPYVPYFPLSPAANIVLLLLPSHCCPAASQERRPSAIFPHPRCFRWEQQTALHFHLNSVCCLHLLLVMAVSCWLKRGT